LRMNAHPRVGAGVKRHDLASLLAQCDFSAPQPTDLQAWELMRPVGREF